MSVQVTKQKPAISARLNSAFKQLWSMHWVMAGCYLILFVGGVFMVRLPEDTALQDNFYTFHKSIGALTMALLTWRIIILQRVWWRKYSRRAPKLTTAWMRTFLLHTAIYVFMLIVPISGFFLSNSYGSGNVSFFWIVTLMDIFPENEATVEFARDAHFWLAYTFLAFILLHTIEQQKYVRSLLRRSSSAMRKMLRGTQQDL
jgi:cytochrome b561